MNESKSSALEKYPELAENFHTEEIVDIITAIPSWILKWGVAIFFGLFIVVLLISALIRYPDNLKSQLTIRSSLPPVIITATTTGRFEKIVVKKGDLVRKGQVLAYFKNNDTTLDAVELLDRLKSLRSKLLIVRHIDLDKAGLPKPNKNFGNLLKVYSKFYVYGVKFGLNITILDELICQMDILNKRNLITAPQSGKVFFLGIIERNDYFNAGDKLFSIEPVNQRYFGIIKFPSNNIYKIKVGQLVNTKLRNYQYPEFNIIKGRVSYIVDEPNKDGLFLIKIAFDNQHRKSNIEFKNWMIGDANIATEDVSLLYRIYSSALGGIN